ncbi:noncanonical pyrimidine nucleotidase, YjjG family [Cohnella sp. CFH 77786]|uniref:YjjG family noncanonical pyrimidine nucleotidase n=1 Tax=Cohnella sp. CFH 77786 TaxID=2662265 RepID=UPI001C60B17B|nr:YjjG family noncanonical pyrimidine nucleotidase [Cohnella sp. CFH 77786]MBW5446220.1 noncanonical pyrimidine nucleotidase, YjjG family [Cohnella sp. CFH 77786]
MYKAIIFDLDNTLLNYDLCELDSMKRTCKDHGLFTDEPSQWESFWKTFLEHNYRYWMDFVNGGTVKSIAEVLRNSFRDTLRKDDTFHNRLTETYWRYFCAICHFEDGAKDVLARVKDRFRLGIVSNGIHEAQRKRLQAGDIGDLFHSIVVSDEVGVRKPKKEIFDIALRELALEREEVLFIGDSLSDDYHGAVNAGIDFCFYNRKNIELPLNHEPKYIIQWLPELLHVIGLEERNGVRVG